MKALSIVSIFFALLLAACGGGGGSTSALPVASAAGLSAASLAVGAAVAPTASPSAAPTIAGSITITIPSPGPQASMCPTGDYPVQYGSGGPIVCTPQNQTPGPWPSPTP